MPETQLTKSETAASACRLSKGSKEFQTMPATTAVQSEAAEVRFPKWCRSICALQPAGARPPLFVFPGGNGGDAELYAFAQLAANHLGVDQPVFAFKPRGADGVSEAHSSVAEMVRDYLAELRQVQPRGPYFFLGDCIGGSVAFAMACALQNQGEEVPFVALSDSLRPSRFQYRRFIVRHHFRKARISFIGRLIFNSHRIITLVTPGGQRWLRERIERRSDHHPEAPKSIIQSVPVVNYLSYQGRRYMRVLTSYKPEVYRGKLHLIVCEENRTNRSIELWKENATEGIEWHVLPGHHINYLYEGAAQIASLCHSAIDDAS